MIGQPTIDEFNTLQHRFDLDSDDREATEDELRIAREKVRISRKYKMTEEEYMNLSGGGY